jgi:putative transposase
MAEYALSQRHACELMEIPRGTQRYVSRRDDGPLRERLIELAQERPRFGYRRLHVLLRRDGWQVNHKRVQRVYRMAGLTVKRIRRRRMVRAAVARPMITAPNQEWAIDFASDVTHGQQRLRIFSVVDACTRECLALEVDTSFPSRRLTRVLEAVIARQGSPLAIRSDNGPEMCSRHYLAWCIEQRIQPVHIQPGRPMQNGHVESFHGRLRDECLNASWFWNLWDARRKIRAWREQYNEDRPHSALGYQTPAEYRRSLGRATPSPQSGSNSARDAAPQGQALRAPAAALTHDAPRADGGHYVGEGVERSCIT